MMETSSWSYFGRLRETMCGKRLAQNSRIVREEAAPCELHQKGPPVLKLKDA